MGVGGDRDFMVSGGGDVIDNDDEKEEDSGCGCGCGGDGSSGCDSCEGRMD